MMRIFGDNSFHGDYYSWTFVTLVTSLNSQLPCAKFTYINTTGIEITRADSVGTCTGSVSLIRLKMQRRLCNIVPFILSADMNTQDNCCPLVQNLGNCVPGSSPCPDRTRYGFFDGFRHMHVLNAGFSRRTYNERHPLDASPYDICQPVHLPWGMIRLYCWSCAPT